MLTRGEGWRHKPLGARFQVMVFAALLLAACSVSTNKEGGASDDATSKELTVFAAASLTAPLEELGREFTRLHPSVKMTFNFAGSDRLRMQLEQGARADVFASANELEMLKAKAGGLLASSPQVFARNRLVLITPRDNPGNVNRLQDLARSGLKLITTGKNTPVGAYTFQALEKMGEDPLFGADFKELVLANVVSEETNVKAIVGKVQMGEADAGIVYASDVTPGLKPKVETIPIPDRYNAIAIYPIAALSTAQFPAVASQFIDYILSDPGQAILAGHNFIRSR